ncbi:hypothetical protein Scep_003924 [Stephania cephalantha]|uniref:Uncharacterized protein n=1 Tax=Stephania cephalantha TaxID=152367 RepID=A0AAP0KU01_9MAGN
MQNNRIHTKNPPLNFKKEKIDFEEKHKWGSTISEMICVGSRSKEPYLQSYDFWGNRYKPRSG